MLSPHLPISHIVDQTGRSPSSFNLHAKAGFKMPVPEAWERVFVSEKISWLTPVTEPFPFWVAQIYTRLCGDSTIHWMPWDTTPIEADPVFFFF